MEVTILQDRLFSGLQVVSGIISPRTTLPILSNLLLEASNGELSLKATDLEIAVSTKTEVSVSTPGSITVPAKQFLGIVKELPNQPVKIEIQDKRVSLKCGKGIFSLIGVEREEFPKFPEIKNGATITLDGLLLQQAIRKSIFAVATDNVRPAMTGVLFQLEGDSLKMVATDGHRLARLKLGVRKNSSLLFDSKSELIISAKALQHLNRLLNEEEKTIMMKFDESYAGFFLKDTFLLSRLIEGPFPPYETVIPKDNNLILHINVAEMISAVRRVSIFSDTFTHQIRLLLRQDSLEISTGTPDIGEAREEMACQYKGSEMEIGYNASYLLDILRNIESERVAFSLKTPTSAGLITPEEGGEETLYLLMPLRLQE